MLENQCSLNLIKTRVREAFSKKMPEDQDIFVSKVSDVGFERFGTETSLGIGVIQILCIVKH